MHQFFGFAIAGGDELTFIPKHKDLSDPIPIAALSRHETEDFPGCASVGFMEVTGKTSCFSKLWKEGS